MKKHQILFAFSLLPLLLALFNPLSAQKTWSGNASRDWSTGLNWNPVGVPDSTDDVIIPDVGNDPIISTPAVARSVTVQASGSLVNKSTLAINGATVQGIFNQGTITNTAAIIIGSTSSVGQFGIMNWATFENNEGATILIDNSATSGLAHFSGTFTNHGDITIGANASVGIYGLYNQSAFNNNTGGTISIDNSGNTGLYNLALGTFVNQSDITIGANAGVGNYGLANAAMFNNTSGTISTDNSTDAGFYNVSGTFTNQASITIGANANVGLYGLYNQAAFNNNTGGAISIGNSIYTGLYNADGTFANHANITIGVNASAGDHGLVNQGAFNNMGGAISIDNMNGTGLSNFSGTFANKAKITIGANGNVGAVGLNNQTTFNNQICGEIAMFAPLSNISSFTNTGLFRVNTASAHTNTALANNGIIEYPQGNPISNVTNNEIIVLPSTGDCQVPNALLLGSPVDFGIATNCYFNPNLTQLAGTYNAASNVFTPVAFVDNTVRTVYFAITDGTGGCSRTVSKQITFDDTVKPMITCPPNATVNLSNTCTTSIGTRTLTSKSDNCTSSANISESQSPGASAIISGHNTVQTVTITANDLSGNTQTCTMTVTARDVTLPNITCPANVITSNNTGLCSSVAEYFAPIFTDNCSATLSLQSGLPSGSAFPVGINTVVYRATDAGGLTKTCSFKVTVNDIQLPVSTCPANQVKTGSGSPCTAVATYANATFTDNCPGGSIVRTNGLPSGSAFPSGINTVVFRATDASGNTRTCSFRITVNCGASPSPSKGWEYTRSKSDAATQSERNIAPPPLRGGREGLLLLPNPTSGLFQIKLQGIEKQSLVLIYDAVGRLVWQQNVAAKMTQLQVDMSDDSFTSGVYWVTLKSEEGVLSKKLILSDE